jgi:alkylhydroperoxidase/carboxymuconolactone decarboxylase family protein YurZ
VLFDEVWERPGLAKRDRSLVTIAALLAGGDIEQLRFHLAFAKDNGVTEQEFAKDNGVTEQELIEAITTAVPQQIVR